MEYKGVNYIYNVLEMGEIMGILTTAIKIKEMDLNNRLVLPPMASGKSTSNGGVTEELCSYYDEITRGGYFGLVIVEHSFVNEEGRAGQKQMSIAQNSDIEGLSRLVSIIKKNGPVVMAQLNHAGGVCARSTCETPISSSPVKSPRAVADALLPREMTQEDIDQVIRDFASAARRAKEAGFDGVEIHSAHGYLLNQFYSPLINHRTDVYSGSDIKGRIKLHLEIIKAVREAVGKEYLLALRLGACDYMEGGTRIEDSIFAAKEFEKAGVDILDISGGFCGFINPFVEEEGYFSELTERIKQHISIPVILTGGIIKGSTGEELLQQNKADLIGVGRAILKDLRWAAKMNLC